MKQNISCISIISEKSLGELKRLQDKIFELTGSKLYREQRPLHITVWLWNEFSSLELEEVSKELLQIAQNHISFTVNLQWILFEESPNQKKVDPRFESYVVRIGVDVNQNLKNLVDEIDVVLRKYQIFFEIAPYHPHMTIAGRDLSYGWFELLQEKLKDLKFETSVLIEDFSLVIVPCKKNKVKKMQEIRKFSLWKK